VSVSWPRRRLTRSPWFGPKRYVGWGWRPCSWQGWLVTVAFLAGVVAAGVTLHLWWTVPLVVAYLVVVVLTGDPPGPPRRDRTPDA